MYQGSGTGQDNECDNCGAQLPMADGSGVRTCTFCKAVYASPQPSAPPQPTTAPGVNVVFNAPGYSTMPDVAFNPVNPPKAKSGCGCGGLFLLIFILASIGVPLYFGLRGAGVLTPFAKDYRFGSNAVALPGEPSGPRSFVTTSSHYADGKTQVEVVRFNGADSSAQWTSPTIPDGTVDLTLLVDGTHAYAFAKTKVYAFKLSDGTQAWQATLSDDVEDFQECACAIVGKKLVVKSRDGVLAAFDASTGAAAWTRTLVQTSYDFVPTRSQVVVFDGEPGQAMARTIDLETGLDLHLLDPVCQGPEERSPTHAGSSGIWKQDPSGDGLVVFFDSSPGCIQGWDVAAGTMTWNAFTDRTSFDDEVELLDTTAGIVTSDRSGVGVIGPDRATYTPLLEDDDMEYRAAGVNGPLLILEAKSRRGTTKMSIQAVELATGTKTWEASLGKAQSSRLDPSSTWSVGSDGTFSAHVDGGKVYVVTMKDNSSYNHTIFVDVIDATTGATSPQVQFPSGSGDLIPAFGPGTWRGSKLLIRIGDDTIQEIDAATGKVTYKVP